MRKTTNVRDKKEIIYQQLIIKLTKVNIMNKKKLFGSIAVLAIASMAAFNVNVNTQEKGLSDISLSNVSALASESECPNGCWDKKGDGCYCYTWIWHVEEAKYNK